MVEKKQIQKNGYVKSKNIFRNSIKRWQKLNKNKENVLMRMIVETLKILYWITWNYFWRVQIENKYNKLLKLETKKIYKRYGK